eukprot:TRINITY_DN12860_c0_g1_i8.p1 TRINITY_DN12860_c0_g1~~TRINITY_DN12860_c0_g1_i8.p1  ORF type:complete len:296 (-),score=64.04 TRINITY_DN12860_c0_g1_i8:199-1086(-)
MIETDEIPADWAVFSQRVDEIWVPANFLVPVFMKAGIPSDKIKVIPEQVDVHMWDPNSVSPLDISQFNIPHVVNKDDFIFLSSFKWEFRKGWDVLLSAYFSEFNSTDPVSLVLHTYYYLHPTPREPKVLEHAINHWVLNEARQEIREKFQAGNLPRYTLITQLLPQVDMPRLYKTANAFVLPTRGEGWGLPIMQGMAMELPTIATNYSGPADFLDATVGYPIPITTMVTPPDGPGVLVQPDEKHVRLLMREVYKNQAAAKEKGKKARKHVVKNFSEEVISKVFLRHFQRLAKQYL